MKNTKPCFHYEGRVFLWRSVLAALICCSLSISESAFAGNCGNAGTLALSTTTSGSCSSSGNLTTYYSNGCAVPDGTCSCAKDESWYKFTTTISGAYVITVVGMCGANGCTVNSGMNAVVEFRSGACNGTLVTGANATGRAGTETITTGTLPAATQYYLRIYSYHCNDAAPWTFTVRVDPPACAPPTATTVNSGGTFCGQTTLLASGGTGGTIYYQGTTSGGTSTATPATAKIITTSGTYYFNSFNGTCWGQEGSATVTITAGPCLQWLNQNCTVAPTGSYIDGGTISPNVTLQTTSTATTPANYGYVFWSFVAVKDSTYYFDLCSSTGTTMSRLRLHKVRTSGANYCDANASDTSLVLENTANGCTGTGVGLSKLIWTCQKSGIYFLESAGDFLTYWGVQSNQTATLNYKTIPSYSFVTSDTFFDKGMDGTNGSSASYNNNEDWIYTYYCTDTIGSAIGVQFLSFSTSPGDVLCVYDGSSINDPIIGCYSGPSITGAFSSTATNGALTFQFTSDDSGISAGWQANVSCVANVGVRSHASPNEIYIFPNPVTEKLVISHPSLVIKEIALYNVLGENLYNSQLIIHNSKPITNIDLSSFPKGIYFLEITTERGKEVKKIVKQ